MALDFTVLLAAAGYSTRMGSHKALMTIGSTTALKASARILNSIINGTFFVTLPPSLLCYLDDEDSASMRRIANHHAHLGYFGSIKTVLEYINSPMQGLFVMPVDAPIFDRRLLWAMVNIARYARTPVIVVPHYQIQPGHPVYVSHHFFEGLAQFRGHHGLRAFIAEHKNSMIALSWPDHRLLANYNYRRDLTGVP